MGRSAGEDSVLEDRCLSIGMIGIDKARDRVLWASQQRLLKASFDGRGRSRNDCPILLVDSMFAKLFAESRCAFARSSKWYSACDGCIEPADNPEIHVARLMVLVLQIQAGGFEQTSIVGRCTLDDPVGWLIENEQVVVFVEDLGGVHDGTLEPLQMGQGRGWIHSSPKFFQTKASVSAAVSISLETGVPAPCPALVSIRIKVGRVPLWQLCKRAANL